MPGVVPGLDIDALLKTSAMPHPERNLCSLLKLQPVREKTGNLIIFSNGSQIRNCCNSNHRAQEPDFLAAIQIRNLMEKVKQH